MYRFIWKYWIRQIY